MEWNRPKLFDVVKIGDPRGNLSVMQYPSSLPFEPVRVYWINDVPAGEMREGHAYLSSREVIVALAGSFTVMVQTADGRIERFDMTRPNQALYVPAMTWRELTGFTTNSVAMVLSDTLYDELDYIRDREKFDQLTKEQTDTDE